MLSWQHALDIISTLDSVPCGIPVCIELRMVRSVAIKPDFSTDYYLEKENDYGY